MTLVISLVHTLEISLTRHASEISILSASTRKKEHVSFSCAYAFAYLTSVMLLTLLISLVLCFSASSMILHIVFTRCAWSCFEANMALFFSCFEHGVRDLKEANVSL